MWAAELFSFTSPLEKVLPLCAGRLGLGMRVRALCCPK